MFSSVSTSIYGRWNQDGGSYYSHFKFSFVVLHLFSGSTSGLLQSLFCDVFFFSDTQILTRFMQNHEKVNKFWIRMKGVSFSLYLMDWNTKFHLCVNFWLFWEIASTNLTSCLHVIIASEWFAINNQVTYNWGPWCEISCPHDLFCGYSSNICVVHSTQKQLNCSVLLSVLSVAITGWDLCVNNTKHKN